MEFISGGSFAKQQTLKTNVKLYEGMELPTKNIIPSTEHRDHQANTQDHDGWKICPSYFCTVWLY